MVVIHSGRLKPPQRDISACGNPPAPSLSSTCSSDQVRSPTARSGAPSLLKSPTVSARVPDEPGATVGLITAGVVVKVPSPNPVRPKPRYQALVPPWVTTSR